VSKIGLVTCSITIIELLGVSINARFDNVCAVCVSIANLNLIFRNIYLCTVIYAKAH
jgi:hypothetical protein